MRSPSYLNSRSICGDSREWMIELMVSVQIKKKGARLENNAKPLFMYSPLPGSTCVGQWVGIVGEYCEHCSELFSAAETLLNVPEDLLRFLFSDRTLRLTAPPPLSSLSIHFYLNLRWLLQLLPQLWVRQSWIVLPRKLLQKNHRNCQVSTSTADSFVSHDAPTTSTMLTTLGLCWRGLLLSDTRWSHTRRCVSRNPLPSQRSLRVSSLKHLLILSQR